MVLVILQKEVGEEERGKIRGEVKTGEVDSSGLITWGQEEALTSVKTWFQNFCLENIPKGMSKVLKVWTPSKCNDLGCI